MHLTKEELKRLAKISHNIRVQENQSYQYTIDSIQNNINYVELSKAFGLHKASLDKISQTSAFSQNNQQRIM